MEPSEKGTKAVSPGTRNETDNRAASADSLKKSSSLYALSFLVLTTVVAGFIWNDLHGAYRDTLAGWDVQLSSAAEARVRVMALWRKDRRRDIELIIRNPLTTHLLSTSGSAGRSRATQQGVEKELEAVRQSFGYLAGVTLDSHCRIAAQVGIRPEMAQAVYDACQQVKPSDNMRVDGFGMERGHLWVIYSVPVNAGLQALPQAQASPRKLGVVAMVSDPWKDITPLIAFESFPTRTSETLILWKNLSEAFIFSPRRSAQGVESVFRRPLDGESFESRVARECDVAFGEFIDYRGVRVLGVARRISATGDGLARKVDWDEALSPYFRRAVLDVLVGALCLLLLGSVMVAQHRHAAVRDFQERFRQQEALRERDRQYRVLFESAAEGILLIRDGHCVDCNQKALELFGCGREHLIGTAPSALSPPQQPNGRDSLEEAREKAKLALAGQTLHFEWQHRRCDGTPFEAEVTLSRLEIVGEAHLLAMVRDVTEQKRAREALRESEAELKEALLAAQMGVWEWTQATDSVTWDENLYRIAGRDPKLPAPSYQEQSRIYTPVSWERLKTAVENTLSAGTPYELDLEMVRPDGSKRWLIARGEPRRDASGRITRLRGTVQDVTERKRAEEALRESDQRYKDFISHSHEGVWRVELEQPIPINLPAEEAVRKLLQYGTMAECNESHAHIMGFSTAQDVVGRHLGELVPATEEERMASFRAAARGGWQSRTVEFQGRDNTGALKHFLRTEIPIVQNGMLERVWGITRDVTELRQAEEALRESEARFRATFENAGIGMALVDLEGHPLKSNPTLRQLLGYGEEELSRMAFTEFTHPADRELDWGLYSELAAGMRDRYEIEKRYIKKDGQVMWGLLTVSSVKGRHGRPAYAVGMVQDITERKRAEEELRESEERYRRLFEVESDAIHLVEVDTARILDVNAAAVKMYGYSREEFQSLTAPEVSAEPEKTRAAITHEWTRAELRWHRKKDGTVFPVEITGNSFVYQGRRIHVATIRDITERQRAEEALRQSEQRYKDFMTHSHEGVWRLGLEQPIPIDLPAEEILERLLQYGYMAECNLAHARNFGFSTPEEMVGTRLHDLIPSSDPERLEAFRGEARRGWVDRTVEFRSRDKAGKIRHFLRTEIPIIENGMLVHVWGITRDVSELKRAEEERQRSLEQLRALAARLQSVREEERKRVAREIHDQLGQALTAIKIDFSSLVHELPAGDKQLSKRTSSILKLVNESIQAVRRIATELRPGMLDDLGLVATIEWAGEEFESRTGIKCRLDLPRGDIAIDPERATAIFRIFQETLTNVARHAEASEVEVRMAKGDGDLTLEVHDNGKGISEDKLLSGKSLGILGMRERAMLLGGELTISGPPGNGTTVRVRIPDPRRT
jgi:PAS domain S-box-containing protein